MRGHTAAGKITLYKIHLVLAFFRTKCAVQYNREQGRLSLAGSAEVVVLNARRDERRCAFIPSAKVSCCSNRGVKERVASSREAVAYCLFIAYR